MRMWHSLPQELKLVIFNYLPPEMQYISHTVCKEWSLMLSSRCNIEQLLGWAADNGYELLCRLAIEWGAKRVGCMFENGAENGHENICRLAKELGDTDFDWMLCIAALGGHETLCYIAIEWGATMLFQMYWGAQEGEHTDLAIIGCSLHHAFLDSESCKIKNDIKNWSDSMRQEFLHTEVYRIKNDMQRRAEIINKM